MRARLHPGVRRRADRFGGIVYVPQRDDFFACSRDVFRVVDALPREFEPVAAKLEPAVRELATFGIAETQSPRLSERSYSGPSFLGSFPEIPTVSEPLVVNCFSTAFCPLQCVYCHADDLMQSYRATERDEDLAQVISTASAVPSLVAVITGGDPLTSPERAARMIDELAGRKALVLDTSGVGDFDALLPLLIEHRVHMRVSLDSISDTNGRTRRANPRFVRGKHASRDGAVRTIRAARAAGLPVTVQTVISAWNDKEDEWRDLRDWLVEEDVRHWVLHIAVKGGKARERERRAVQTQRRPSSILPGGEVRRRLWSFIKETRDHGVPMDIRVTDTDSTPNSVLLINSQGDLYTEGFAHDGKVVLFEAGAGRPDLLRDLWPHIDAFGHARRYLNWNPWLFDGESLDRICHPVPVPESSARGPAAYVETEAKHVLLDPDAAQQRLVTAGFTRRETRWQRDEYFDDANRTLDTHDYVVRMRQQDVGTARVSFKGPRFPLPTGEQSRIELEVNVEAPTEARADWDRQDLVPTWIFEKRRTDYTRGRKETVSLDEIPEVGWFVEIEGSMTFIAETRTLLGDCIGPIESRNYKELFVAFKLEQGIPEHEVAGAEFRDDEV